MHVCVCVFTFAYVCVHVFVYLPVCIYMCIYVCPYTCVRFCVCVCVHMWFASAFVQVPECMCACIHDVNLPLYLCQSVCWSEKPSEVASLLLS